MRSDVANDLSQSAKTFIDVVWPVIGQAWFGSSTIMPVEAVTQEIFAKHLDADAGVDAWLIRETKGITPLASRVQKMRGFLSGCTPYNTFTIRSWRSSGYDTELQKRMRAINQPHRGYLYPHVTIQAYVRGTDNAFLSAAAVLTRDLYKHIDSYEDRVNGDGKSGFKVASWDQLNDLGATIHIKIAGNSPQDARKT